MMINVDTGEGKAGDPRDLGLLQFVDALNLALGGHAGELEWIRELADRGQEAGCQIHLHPSFPDRENFGRNEMDLPWVELARSLSAQRAVLPQITGCKFHGALYNLAATDSQLAGRLVTWCGDEGISLLLAPPNSELEKAAEAMGLEVLREGFVDRAYWRDAEGRVGLCPRSLPGAFLDSPTAAVAQARQISSQQKVSLLGGGTTELSCDTLCFHGDGESSLEIGRALKEWKEEDV